MGHSEICVRFHDILKNSVDFAIGARREWQRVAYTCPHSSRLHLLREAFEAECRHIRDLVALRKTWRRLTHENPR